MRRTILAVAVAVGAVVAAGARPVPADGKAADKPKADPPGTPLELTIVGKKTAYTLDTGGQTPAEYKKSLDAALKAGGRLPAAPAVDLEVEIKNTSDKPVQVWVKGDAVVLDLELKGTGRLPPPPALAFTREFRLPVAAEIAPGKTHTLPLKSLTGGFRGASKFSYWTAPGDYTLVATLKTAVSPAPKGAKDAGDEFGTVVLTSAPFKLTVEAKK